MAWRIPSSMVMAAISVVLACRAGFFLSARAPREKPDPSARDQTGLAERRLSRGRLFLQRRFLRLADWRVPSAAFWKEFSPYSPAAHRFRSSAAVALIA